MPDHVIQGERLMSAILTEQHNAVAILTINRPATLNALDVPTLLELEAAFGALETDQSVRVIVFTGAGQRAFVAGGDIADLDSRQGLAPPLHIARGSRSGVSPYGA